MLRQQRLEHAEILSAQILASEQAAQQGIKLKPTTGLVGVPVQPRWRPMMLKLIDDVLHELSERIPANTFYRTATENNFRFFQKVVQENDDYEVVEDIINRGQVEELIMMFEDELILITKMQEWQPWVVTQESVDIEKDLFTKHDTDPMLPDDYKYPYDDFKYATWDGIYQVEYTEEELLQMEQEKQRQAEEAIKKAEEAAAASQNQKKKP